MKYSKIWLIVVVLAGFALLSSKKADATEIKLNSFDVSLGSYHTKRCYSKCTKKFNERNYGISGTYDLGNHKSLVGGTLQNSFHKQSFYGGINFYANKTAAHRLLFRPGLMLGLMNGYKDTPSKAVINDSGIVPIISLNLSTYYKERYHFNIGAFPAEDGVVFSFRVGLAI